MEENNAHGLPSLPRPTRRCTCMDLVQVDQQGHQVTDAKVGRKISTPASVPTSDTVAPLARENKSKDL